MSCDVNSICEHLSSLHSQQAQQLLGICREYIIGLSMEVKRKELPKVTSSSCTANVHVTCSGWHVNIVYHSEYYITLHCLLSHGLRIVTVA